MDTPVCDVLVLDDDALVLETLCEVLRDVGLRVTEARNSSEALAQFNLANKPRVLVTDVDLGEPTDGRDVARKAQLACPGLPVVFITGRPDRFWGTVLQSHERFLPKPFRPAALIAAIHQVEAVGWRP